MKRSVILAILSSLVALDLFAVGAAAQGSPPLGTTTFAVAQASSASKLSFRLEALAHTPALRAASPADQANALSLPAQGAGSLTRNARGQLLVYIRMADMSEPQLQALRAAGGQIVHVSNRYPVVTAFADVAALTDIAAVTAVQSVQEVLAPMVAGGSQPSTLAPTRLGAGGRAPLANCPQGAAVSEGDTQLNAASARSTFGIDGTGVKVGILSDSYDQSTGVVTRAITDVQTGDLPGVGNPCGFLTPVNVISPSLATGNTDEGRGMMQIVHDLAPGVQLSFASAMNGEFEFADNIRALRAAGADIIADDVSYYDEPFFQEGPVSVAISDVVGSGALYFTAAGNENEIVGGKNVASYEAPVFRPAACPAGLPAGAGPYCHNFNASGGTNTTSAITLANRGLFYIDFQYDEPWYGVTTNLDIYLLNSSNKVVASSVDDNLITQTPFEFLPFLKISGSPQQYRIVINRKSGSGTPRLKYILITSSLTAVQYNTSSGGDIVGPTIMGHSATHFGFSVAAVPYNNSNQPETYTSRGPAAHYYGPVVGTTPASAISPYTLQQPDFAATDGGCTTFFYSFSNGCYRFYGTSAAAPHAAAVAALLKQKANQLGVSLSAAKTKSVLQSTASSVSGGDINSVGAGLLNALAATQALVNQVTTTSLASSKNPATFGETVFLTATVTASGGTPTGSVQFYADGSTSGPPATLSSGSASFATSTLAPATHAITATYSGDSNFNGSTSTPLAQQVNKADTTTTITAHTPNPSAQGQPVAVTFSVDVNPPGIGTPTGTVTVTGDAINCAATLPATSCNLTFASTGTKTLSAQYGGDDNLNGSTSTGVSHVVNAYSASIAIASSQNPTVFGESVTFTASVTSTQGTPTGTVQFKADGANIGSVTLVNGDASISTTSLSAGTRAITALYSGDTNFGAGTGTLTGGQVVSPADTSTTITNNTPNPSTFGQSVTFTAIVGVLSPGSGTLVGNVTFKDGATTLGTSPLSGGTALFTTAGLTAGTHDSITAVYDGGTNFNPSTSPPVSQSVNQAVTVAAVTANTPNPSIFGQAVVFTATVTSAGGIPTGLVTFRDDATVFGTGLLSAGGIATTSVTTLTVGAHNNITAQYAGDANFIGSTSAAVAQTVKGSVTVSLSSSPSPLIAGKPITLTATVKPNVSGAAARAGRSPSSPPSGTVTFKDGSTTLGTAPLSNGVATLTTTLTAGSHSLTAQYSGDGAYGANATTIPVTVNQNTLQFFLPYIAK